MTAFPDPVREAEEALFQCLESAEPRAALAELERRDPGLAHRVRPLLERLEQQGMLGGGPQAAIPQRLGPYEILRRLGEGGMGVVFEAREASLGRRVAVKLIRPELLTFPKSVQRFENEIAVLAKLHHPGIAQVLSAGEEGGLRYFALEFVEGESIADVLHRLWGRQPGELHGRDLFSGRLERVDTDSTERSLLLASSWVDACVRVVRDVARALAHAHECGVLHRDLKPGNVMLGTDGRPRLVDFGLARTEEASSLTRTGAAVGSLAYMAPEQLLGQHDAVDERSDVYSLGVLLFELLSLQSPYLVAGDAAATQARILRGRAPSLRRLNPDVGRDAAMVCRRAMARAKNARYATATQFASELDALIAGSPVHVGSRLRRVVHRHPTAMAAASLIGAVGCVALLAWGLSLRSDRAAAEADAVALRQTATTAGTRAADAEMIAYIACLEAAQREIARGYLSAARVNLRRAPAALRSWEWKHLMSRTRLGGREWRLPHSSGAWHIGANERFYVSVSNQENWLLFADPGTGRTQAVQKLGTVRLEDPLTRALSARGERYVGIVESAPRRVQVADLVARSVRTHQLDHPGEFCFVSDDGSVTGVSHADGTAVVFESDSGHEIARIDATRGARWSAAAISPDNQTLAIALRNGDLRLYDLAAPRPRWRVVLEEQCAVKLEFAPGGRELRCQLGRSVLEARSVRDGELTFRKLMESELGEMPVSEIAGFVSDPDGETIWTWHADGFVRLLHRPTGQWIKEVLSRELEPGDRHRIGCVAVDPVRGRLLASGLERRVLDRSLRSLRADWDYVEGGWSVQAMNDRGDLFVLPDNGVPVLRRHDGSRTRLEHLPSGQGCAFLSRTRVAIAPGRVGDTVTVYDIDAGEVVARLSGHQAPPRAVIGLPGELVATGDRAGRVYLFDLAAGTHEVLEGHDDAVKCFAALPDGRFASASHDGSVRLWDPRTKNSTLLLNGETPFYALAVSPDGRWLVAGGEGRGARVYDLAAGRVAPDVVGPRVISGLAFTADGRRLVLVSHKSRFLRVYDVGSWRRVLTITFGHGALLNTAAFAPDGDTLITSDRARFVRLWFGSQRERGK